MQFEGFFITAEFRVREVRFKTRKFCASRTNTANVGAVLHALAHRNSAGCDRHPNVDKRAVRHQHSCAKPAMHNAFGRQILSCQDKLKLIISNRYI